MNTRSIHFRLVLWYCIIAIMTCALVGASIYSIVRVKIYGEIETLFGRRAQSIASNILPHVRDKTPAGIAAQIDQVFYPEESNRFIRILNPDHSVLYVSGPSKNGHFNPSKIEVPAGYIPRGRLVDLGPGDPLFVVAVKADVNGKIYTVETGGETDVMEETLRTLISTQLLLLPALVALLTGGGLVLVRRSLQPVEAIRRTAGEITAGNLKNRLPVAPTGDAIEQLSLTLNQMLGRLSEAYDQSSRFAADAAHELRTPLAIMRGEMESLVREPKLDSRLKGRVASMLEEAERLSRITEMLLAMSRLDSGESKLKDEPVDFAAMAKDTAEQMALLADEKQIRLDIDARGPATVRGDAARLKEVVVNLLDNAIKYTPARGHVSIRVFVADHTVVFEVEDTGIGIPQESLPHVFDRFYRVDKARSREEGGTGLGLSIAQSICHAHRGTISVRSTEGRGTVCRVELALAAPLKVAQSA